MRGDEAGDVCRYSEVPQGNVTVGGISDDVTKLSLNNNRTTN